MGVGIDFQNKRGYLLQTQKYKLEKVLSYLQVNIQQNTKEQAKFLPS